MQTLFWERQGREKPTEYSNRVAGGGRSNVPSKSVIGGITKYKTQDIEHNWDFIKPAAECKPEYSLEYSGKREIRKGFKFENQPNEKAIVNDARLKFH